MTSREFWHAVAVIVVMSLLIGIIAGSWWHSFWMGFAVWLATEGVLVSLLLMKAIKDEQ
jgi:uncharacterized protein (DUF983 family)